MRNLHPLYIEKIKRKEKIELELWISQALLMPWI